MMKINHIGMLPFLPQLIIITEFILYVMCAWFVLPWFYMLRLLICFCIVCSDEDNNHIGKLMETFVDGSSSKESGSEQGSPVKGAGRGRRGGKSKAPVRKRPPKLDTAELKEKVRACGVLVCLYINYIFIHTLLQRCIWI